MKGDAGKGKTCTCNGPHMFIGLILLAVGFFIVVAGFVNQLNNALNYISLVWYFVGFLVMVFGKMYKHKGCGNCSVHKM